MGTPLWARLGVALTVCVMTGCDDTSGLLGPDAMQGIEGLALLGPLCPVASLEEPCPDRPYDAWIRIRTGGGKLVIRLRTGEDGRFRVGLEPGTYVVDPESGHPFPTANAQEVEVRDGAYTEVSVFFDTGIR